MADYLLSHTGTQIDAGIDAALNINSTLEARIGSTGPAACRNKFHNTLFQTALRGGGTVSSAGAGNWLFDRADLRKALQADDD